MDSEFEAIDTPSIILSSEKLQNVAESLRTWVPEHIIRQLPCETTDQTIAYRCRCTFQIVWTAESLLHFAVRQNHVPVIMDSFPIANRRIQLAMTALQTTLNDSRDDYIHIRQNLTSAAFSSAWRDSDDSECLVTLFYDKLIQQETNWEVEAARLNRTLNVTQVSARSRKQVLRTIKKADEMVRDTIWLINCNNAWLVHLEEPSKSSDVDGSRIKKVIYEKPEGAFFHPNATAMCAALEWLIQRVDQIHKCKSVSSEKRSQLLELYCGFGAHTVALMQTEILESIVAVELDERLVNACKRNVSINQSKGINTNKRSTVVNVTSSDAGLWAKKFYNIDHKIDSMDILDGDRFDILLVDPPRQGLDESVCRMAINGSFNDFLYISCGRDALIRDLKRLLCDFEVVDCKLIDLFPQTDAVESLMHLRRRTIVCTDNYE